MKLMLGLLICGFCLFANAQDSNAKFYGDSKDSLFKEASNQFSSGKYEATITELNNLEFTSSMSKTSKGLIFYWKAICYNRLQDFSEAIKNFDKALGLEYSPVDLNYEYGQALFAAEKLSEARLQFRESLKKKFKRAVSLYYIAYISKEMGEKKKAITFYQAIKKIDASESMEIRQAAEMQIGDIYLEQAEKNSDALRTIENYVIPQYQIAYEVDKNSPLAPLIQEKILKLQNKYDLILFKLRNGRPTEIPPYFMRLALEYGIDSNVTFSPTQQEIAESKKNSGYTRTDAMGKFTFYPSNFISIAPEFRFNYIRYINRIPEIYRNDNYVLAPAIRTTYEHTWNNKAASVLFDYDYNDAKRDVNEEQKLKFAFRSHTLMLGERFNFFRGGDSTIRLKRRFFDSYLDTSDSKTLSIIFEQNISMTSKTLAIYSSYDVTKVKSSSYDTNGLMIRTDLIMGMYKDWFSPSLGIAVTRIDPINNSDRGIEYLINPSFRLSRVIKKNLHGNLKFDYSRYISDDKDNFDYKKYISGFELEYIF